MNRSGNQPPQQSVLILPGMRDPGAPKEPFTVVTYGRKEPLVLPSTDRAKDVPADREPLFAPGGPLTPIDTSRYDSPGAPIETPASSPESTSVATLDVSPPDVCVRGLYMQHLLNRRARKARKVAKLSEPDTPTMRAAESAIHTKNHLTNAEIEARLSEGKSAEPEVKSSYHPLGSWDTGHRMTDERIRASNLARDARKRREAQPPATTYKGRRHGRRQGLRKYALHSNERIIKRGTDVWGDTLVDYERQEEMIADGHYSWQQRHDIRKTGRGVRKAIGRHQTKMRRLRNAADGNTLFHNRSRARRNAAKKVESLDSSIEKHGAKKQARKEKWGRTKTTARDTASRAKAKVATVARRIRPKTL